MKIKSIAAICKKNKQVVLFNRYSDSGTISQYIGDGSAVYPISGLPELDEESILTIFEMIRTQRHSRFVLMSLDEIRATRDIVLQTEETKSNFSGSGKTVYICEVVRPCDYQKETDTAADKLAAEIERVNADNRALRRKVERLERELQKARAGA